MEAPEAKFHAIVVGTLVPLIVIGVAKLAPFLSTASAGQTAVGVVAAALASAGIYKLIARLLLALLRRVTFVKRFVLGASYMHGTWVGWFIGHAKDLRYIVEVFEQDLGTLVIRGKSFAENGDEHAQWESEAVTIDAFKGRLIYTSTAHILTSPLPYQSLSVLQFERTRQTDPPNAIDGYVSDVHDGRRLPLHEQHISDTLLPFRDALPCARDVFSRRQQ
jgi:hypothetical protein